MLCWLMAWAAAHVIDGPGWLSMGGAGSTPRTPAAHGSALSPRIGVAMSDAIGASERDYWASAVGAGAYTADNPAQGLHERFGAGGVRVAAGGLRVRMQLRSLGYGPWQRPLDAPAPSAAANGVRYLDGALAQSYANGPAGLEQSFTLTHAPPGAGARPLMLTIALAGNAHATLGHDGQTLTLAGAGRSLRYGGLLATDAAGRRLASRMSLDGSVLRLQVNASGARYPIRIDPLIEQTSKLVSPEAAGTGGFGYSVALSANGSEALVGAPEYDKGRGAVWAFTRSGSTWVQQGEALIAIGTSRRGRPAGGHFGYSVALSSDGTTALIGAPREGHGVGAAWVFVLTAGEWEQGPNLAGDLPEEAAEAHLGKAVALSADGDTALVGAPGEESGRGAVWSFARTGEGWSAGSELTAPTAAEGEALFGSAVALAADGDTALVGAPGERKAQGAAWVFSRSEEGAEWNATGSQLSGGGEPPAGRFGYSVALSGDGSTALVGGSGAGDPGNAWAFERTGSSWSAEQLHGEGAEKGYDFGASVSLSQDGATALVGGPADGDHEGAAWLWERSGGRWLSQGNKLAGEEESGKGWFGESVALSANGETALIGGPHDSAKVGAVWTLFASAAPPPPPEPPEPTVTEVTPVEGPEAGDTEVTIAGSGFTEGATVTIGSEARDVAVLSEHEIKAVTSETAAGSYPVVVEDAHGTSSGGARYRYTAPEAVPGTNTNNTNTNTSQSSSSASGGVLGVIARAIPAPVLGVSGNIAPILGKVTVELPGSSVFVPLTQVEQVPFGTIVNATDGKVEVTTMGPHGLQTMYFYGGEFKLVQHKNGMVVAILTGGDFQVCPTKRERAHIATAGSAAEAASAGAAATGYPEATESAGHASGKHVVRKLWSSGHGSYSTKGNYASGAVLGTVWLTEDRCDGTEIFVATDKVAVTSLVTHRHRVVHAGHLYLAKAP